MSPAFAVVACCDDHVEDVDVTVSLNVAVRVCSLRWLAVSACYEDNVGDVDVSVAVHVTKFWSGGGLAH